MNIDWTKKPKTLPEAVNILFAALSDADIAYLASTPDIASQLHHSLGRDLRNKWNLWGDGSDTLLAWFRQEVRIGHPDDMSGLILDSLVARCLGIDFDLKAAATKYHEHWKKAGLNEFGEEQ